MARLQRVDRSLEGRLDALETSMFKLKVSYDKYFSGIDRIEPASDREDLRRTLREVTRLGMPSTVQRHRFQMLKARFISLDSYIARNLFLIERGQHPRDRFRAARMGGGEQPSRQMSALEAQREKEEAAFKSVYERYSEARSACGQSSQLDFTSFRSMLSKQVRMIKSRYKCEGVKFRVAVDGGKAQIKAVPMARREPRSEEKS